MKKKNDDKECFNKLLDLCLICGIKESEFYIKALNNRIKFYQCEIRYLENTKPLFFRRRKLEEHNKLIEECEQNIYNTYKMIEEEFKLIHQIQDKVDNG